MSEFCLLVVAKAPVAGLAKTRLCPPATPAQAADIAAAALLDTLDAVRATPGARPMVALTGELVQASQSARLYDGLRHFAVFSQRGKDFANRLANAHADAARLRPGLPVVQIGMDTPQVTPDLLAHTANRLADADAVVAPARDGGWWALALRDPAAADHLRTVPMSRADTGEQTVKALTSNGYRTIHGDLLSDVDIVADALRVAGEAPEGRFAAAVRSLG
ncbi:MAG TPA: DUF2064 domain-containing protein [Pseudonocardiaceae bacterium]|jgi:hypothetical protein|nr:DUF2064 domain-containing protein [Pseudonocardiaceae bacterium]